MKKTLLPAALACFVLNCFCTEMPLFRYGIFVASSRGFNETILTNAAKEVQGMARLFKEYCLLDDCQILEDPGNSELTAAFVKAAQIIDSQNTFSETHLFFYYFGHGIPDGFLLGNELYSKTELKEKLALIKARIRFVFIDACSSEIMGAGEYLDFRTQSEGTVFITSSSLFEQAFAGIFSPVLKAGLMGDADGFIPDQFAAPFFYNEISTKLEGEERSFINDLYGFREYYDYRALSPEKETETKNILTSLGIAEIPPRPHFSWLYEELLPALKNSTEKKLIQAVYNYSEVCLLKKKRLSPEKKRIAQILEKVGFKKDNFVTLVELFSYIRARVTEKKTFRQTPTINTSSLSRREAVRLSYNENKIAVLLKFPGIIFIKRVTIGNVLQTILTINPALNSEASASITLAPGRYVFLVESGDIRYRIEKELLPGSDELVLENPDWSAVEAFKEEVVVNGVSEVQWIEKRILDKKLSDAGNMDTFAGITTLSALAGTLSLLAAGISCNIQSDNLYDRYDKATTPDETVDLRRRINSLVETRDTLYLFSGISLSLSLASAIFWAIAADTCSKHKRHAEKLKDKSLFGSVKPDIGLTGEQLTLGFQWQLP